MLGTLLAIQGICVCGTLTYSIAQGLKVVVKGNQRNDKLIIRIQNKLGGDK